MKRLLGIVALALIALAVLAWRMPASVIRLTMPAQAAKFVQLHALDGTLWQGRARFTPTAVPIAVPIAWSCRPSLAPLGLRCTLHDGLSAEITLDAWRAMIHVTRLTSAALPVQYAAGAIPIVEASDLVFTITEGRAARDTLALGGNVRARNVRATLAAAPLALGEVTLDCAPDTAPASAQTRCTLANRGGGARLDGTLTLGMGGASGTVTLTPVNGAAQQLRF